MTLHSFPALGFDPSPGNPPELTSVAEDCSRFAAELLDDAGRARALRDGFVWSGPAADAFRDRLKDVPRDLDRAGVAYHEAGSALAEFSALLAGHQDQARQFEALAAEQARLARDPAPAVADQACAQLAVLRHSADRLRETVQSEARRCNGRLHHATAHAPRPPGWFARALGGFGDLVKDVNARIGAFVRANAGHIAALASICSKISSALALVAMVVGPIPILGEAVGTLAVAGALLTGGIALASHALLATYAGGKWGPVVFDAIALGTSLAGAKGVPALAGKLAQARGWEMGASEAISLGKAVTTLRHPGLALAEGATSELTFARLVSKTISFQFDGAGGSLGAYDLAAGLPAFHAEVTEAQDSADRLSEQLRGSGLSGSSDLTFAPRLQGARQ